MNNSFLKSKTFNKILAVVIAIFLWAYVISVDNPTVSQTYTGIPVTLQNLALLEEVDYAMYELGDFTVNVTLEGKRIDLAKISSDDLVVTANVGGLEIGEHRVALDVKVPYGATAAIAKPSQISVTIEKKASEPKPVELSIEGAIPEGKEIGSRSIKPGTITVTGARSRVASVARIKVSVNAADITENGISRRVVGIPVDQYDQEVEGVTLETTRVTVSAKLYETKSVPLYVPITGEVAAGYHIDGEIEVPNTIRVKGEAAYMANVTQVTATPISIEGLQESINIPILVQLPEGIELSDTHAELYAVVNINKMEEKVLSYTADDISILGLNEAFDARIVTEEILLKIQGAREELTEVLKSQFSLSIDLTDVVMVGVGEYVVKADYGEGEYLLEIEPAAVRVIVTEKE